MKKLISLLVCGVLSISVIGCNSEDIEQEVVKVDENTEEQIEETEESVEDHILTIEDENFKYHMTNSLLDEEYDKYFDSLYVREVEFDGSIDIMQLREGYDTRMELLLTLLKYFIYSYGFFYIIYSIVANFFKFMYKEIRLTSILIFL